MGYRNNAWHLLMATLIQKVDFLLKDASTFAVNRHELVLNIYTDESQWRYIAAYRVCEAKPVGSSWEAKSVRTFKGLNGVSVNGVPFTAEDALIRAKAYLYGIYTSIISNDKGYWPTHTDKLSEVCIADWLAADLMHPSGSEPLNPLNAHKTKEQAYNALFDGLGESW